MAKLLMQRELSICLSATAVLKPDAVMESLYTLHSRNAINLGYINGRRSTILAG